MIVLDATTLLLLIEPSAKPPKDPSTGKPLEKCKDRIENLIQTLSGTGSQVLLPTPVLAEILVRAGNAKDKYLPELTTTSAFKLASFDARAAVELSMILDTDLKSNKKLTDKQTWAKLKFDRQIIAIARVHSVSMIYTDDVDLAKCAKANNVDATHTWQLPLPPVAAQQELPLAPPKKGE
jgi:predicted nucleic acid-binding protein